MRKITNRLLAVLMALVMVIGLLPAGALAEGDLEGPSNEVIVKEYHLMNRNSFWAYFEKAIYEKASGAWGIVLNGMQIVDKDDISTWRQADIQAGNIYNVYAGRDGSTSDFIQPDDVDHITLHGTYATKSQWWAHSFSVDIPRSEFEIVSHDSQSDTQSYAEIYFAGEAPQPDVIDVTFDLGYEPDEGARTFDVPVIEGSTVKEALAVRDGYDFLGWFAPDAETPFDFETPINAPITLTARWAEKPPVVATYTLTIEYHYNNNGNGDAVSADELTKTLNSLELPGVSYVVSNGKLELTISESALEPDDTFNYADFVFEKLANGAVLTPAGQASNTKTAFDKDGDAINHPQLTYKKQETPTPVESNAWFFLRKDGVIPTETGTSGYDGSKYAPAHTSTPLTGKVSKTNVHTDYAGIIDEYGTINGTALDEAFENVSNAIIAAPSEAAIKAAVPSFDPTTQGVIWYVIKNNVGSTDKCPGVHVDGIIYNKSTGNTFSLAYMNNFPGVESDTSFALVPNLPANKNATITSDIPADHNGYTFTGWNTTPTGQNGIAYSAGNSIMMDGDKVLFAQWKLKTYAVTYNWGTQNIPESVKNALPTATPVSHGGSYTVDTTYTSSTTVKADGGTYTFSGWNLTGEITNITAPVSIIGSWSFKADVIPGPHSVTYEWSGAPASAVIPGNDKVTHNSTYTVDTTYTSATTINANNGTYTFSGWKVKGGADEVVTSVPNVTAAFTLTGVWKFVPDTYTVVYHAAEGHQLNRGDDAGKTSYTVQQKTTDRIVSFGVWLEGESGQKVTMSMFREAKGFKSNDFINSVTFAEGMVVSTLNDKGNATPFFTAANGAQLGGTYFAKGSEVHILVSPIPTTYTVTYNYTGSVPDGMTAPVDATPYAANAQVTLATAPVAPANYTFGGWTLPEGVTAADGKFSMPEANVTVTGNWTYSAPGGGGGDNGPTYRTVTVNYLEQDSNKVLADAYTLRDTYNSTYDVAAQAARAIDGYAISSTDGETSGRLLKNLTINVYYTAVEDIPDDDTPLAPGPGNNGGTDIPDEETPLAPTPETPDNGSIVIEEENVPLGNLPQTGTTAQSVNPALTLGLLALAFSMAATGLTVSLTRKKEEEN